MPLLDRCIFIPNTDGGTADFQEGTVVTGYQSMEAAGAVNNSTYSYVAQSADLSQWEVGIGTYISANKTLQRTTIQYNSSGTTAKINFLGGAPQVMLTALASDFNSGGLTVGTSTVAGGISGQFLTDNSGVLGTSAGSSPADEVHVLNFLQYLPQATFTGSISGTTLTVTGTPTGIIVPGQTISGSGISTGTVIYLYGTGAGGAGTYTVNNSQSVSLTTITTQSGDYTPVYQAAIDYAVSSGISRILCLPYATKIYSSIFLDPPGSLRTNSSTGAGGWTLDLIGSGPPPGASGSFGPASLGGGTSFQTQFDSSPALWVGTGNQCKVSRITCFGEVSVAHPKLHNSANAAIAIAGGNSGATKTRIEDCYIYNFYTAVSVGQNATSLGEVNTLVNVQCQLCYYGFWTGGVNECVNELYNCCWCASYGIYSIATMVRSYGGELTGPSGAAGGGPAEASQYAGISSVSALTRTGSLTSAVYTFTATIASPSAAWGNNVFNACVLILPYFGLVPCVPIAFNAGTNVATFQITESWVLAYYFAYLNLDSTDFNTELQAATNIYACEMCTAFYGLVQARGWRLELTTSYCVMQCVSGGAFGGQLVLENGYCNYDVTLNEYFAASPGTNNYAHFAAQQCFGFIVSTASNDIIVQNNNWGFDGTGYPGYKDTVVIDLYTNQGSAVNLGRFIWRNNTPLMNPNIRQQGNILTLTNSEIGYGYSLGDSGEFDVSPFVARASFAGNAFSQQLSLANNYVLRGQGTKTTPYKGFLPQGGMQRITSADVNALQVATTLLNVQAFTYPVYGTINVQPIQDHHVCVVSQSDYQNYALAKRNGKFFSYGAALTIDGSFKPGTPFVNTTGGSNVGWLFPGLEVVIEDQVNSVFYDYVVTGVYYSFNYFTVSQITPGAVNAGYPFLAPSSNYSTAYTFTTVGQNPIVMQKFGRQCEFVNSALSELIGNTYSTGDIVWIANATASASPGWVCVTSGTVASGSGAKFAAMPVLGTAVFSP